MATGKFARWLHLGHRWLGVLLAPMLLLWFVSGLVMLFVARPQLDEAARLAASPVLATASVRLSPAAAWQALGLPGAPRAIRLHAAGGRPAYRLLAEDGWHAVAADDGEVLPPFDAAAARRLLVDLAGARALFDAGRVDVDQWTVYRSFDAQRPFWLLRQDNGREFYVSSRSGELALVTSRSERAWNWLGSVVHWLYLTPLRQHGVFWRQLLLWLAFAGILASFSGVWLGWQRLRLRRRYGGDRRTPYRDAWKKWHHLLGLGVSLILLLWLVSGWLSLNPLGLAAAPARSLGRAALDVATLAQVPQPTAGSRELEWLRLGEHTLRLDKGEGGSRIILAGRAPVAALTLADIEAALRAVPGLQVAGSAWLTEPDHRYFPLRHYPRSFPVARITLADENGSILYVSPESGRIVLVADAHDFTHRWLYQGLHRLDFPVLVRHPLARDALIVLLSALGLAFCLTGCRLAWGRLRRTRPNPAVDSKKWPENQVDRGILPVRRLLEADRPAVLSHLLALTADDRYGRFASALADEGIAAYVARIDFAGDLCLGIVEADGALSGFIHLAVHGKVAELGASVASDCRGQGRARRLFAAALNEAVLARLAEVHLATGHPAARHICHSLGYAQHEGGGYPRVRVQLATA